LLGYQLDVQSGPAIVITSTALFVVSLVVRRAKRLTAASGDQCFGA